MRIFVPISIKKLKEDSYEGSFPFDSSYSFQASSKQNLLNELEKEASYFFQKENNLKFKNYLETSFFDWKKDWLLIDSFSKNEHKIFFLAFSSFFIVLFLILLLFSIWIYSLFPFLEGLDLNSLLDEDGNYFLNTIYTYTPYLTCVCFFFWLLSYNFLYVWLIELYSKAINSFSIVKNFHDSIFFWNKIPDSKLEVNYDE